MIKHIESEKPSANERSKVRRDQDYIEQLLHVRKWAVKGWWGVTACCTPPSCRLGRQAVLPSLATGGVPVSMLTTLVLICRARV